MRITDVKLRRAQVTSCRAGNAKIYEQPISSFNILMKWEEEALFADNTILFDSTDLIYIMLTKARIFSPWARSVVNSYIASRLFVFLFNSLIFYQFWHLSLLSLLTSLRVFTRSYRRIHGVFLTELFYVHFSYFVILFFSFLIISLKLVQCTISTTKICHQVFSLKLIWKNLNHSIIQYTIIYFR